MENISIFTLAMKLILIPMKNTLKYAVTTAIPFLGLAPWSQAGDTGGFAPSSTESLAVPPADIPGVADAGGPAGGLLSNGLAISAGYDTDYMWRGANFGNDLTWFDVSLDIDLTEEFSLNIGAWNGSWDAGDELDIYASTDFELGAFTFTAGWTYYYFYGDLDHYHEFNIGTSVDIGPVSVGLTYYIAPDDEDYDYLELSAEASFEVSGFASLELGAVVGYGDGQFNAFQGANDNGDATHIGITAGLAIALRENVTLTPYIGFLAPLGEMEDVYDDDVYGGVSLGVEF